MQISKYPNLQTVKEDRGIEKGWVPAILPGSAYDIEETHDIDTNQLVGRFYYREKDEAGLMEKMTALPDSNGTYEWGGFLFRVDRKKNLVRYRNRPVPATR